MRSERREEASHADRVYVIPATDHQGGHANAIPAHTSCLPEEVDHLLIAEQGPHLHQWHVVERQMPGGRLRVSHRFGNNFHVLGRGLPRGDLLLQPVSRLMSGPSHHDRVEPHERRAGVSRILRSNRAQVGRLLLGGHELG